MQLILETLPIITLFPLLIGAGVALALIFENWSVDNEVICLIILGILGANVLVIVHFFSGYIDFGIPELALAFCLILVGYLLRITVLGRNQKPED